MSLPARREPEELIPGYVPALASFLQRRVIAAPGQRLDWADIYREFVTPDWRSPPSPRAMADALAFLCKRFRVRVGADGHRLYCLDCAWQDEVPAALWTEAEPAPAVTPRARARRWLRPAQQA